MTARYSYELHCDAPGCSRTFSGLPRAAASRALARREEGWVHAVALPGPRRGGPAKSLDFCGEHAAQLGAVEVRGR